MANFVIGGCLLVIAGVLVAVFVSIASMFGVPVAAAYFMFYGGIVIGGIGLLLTVGMLAEGEGQGCLVGLGLIAVGGILVAIGYGTGNAVHHPMVWSVSYLT